jgi:hypothetical protein
MRTDVLIDKLAQGVVAVRPGAARRRLAAVAGLGALAALVLVLAWLQPRPDLAVAVRGPIFWAKLAYTLILALGGFLALERLARPGLSPRRGVSVALGVLAAAVLLGAVQWLAAPAAHRASVWLGHSWSICPFNILALSIPGLVLGLLAVRRLAPTRLVAAGAAVGALAGAAAGCAYGLHCPESTATFVATWYSLGVLLPTALGALAGPWALRW